MSIRRLFPGFAAIVVTFQIFVTVAHAQSDSTDLAAGRQIYNQFCATCHGFDTRGGNSSTLFDEHWLFGGKDEDIRKLVNTGIEDLGMPSYAGVLDDEQTGQLIAYIRSMKGHRIEPVADAHQQGDTLDYKLKIERWIPQQAGLKIPWAIDFIDGDTALVTELHGPLRMAVKGVLHPDPIAGTPQVLRAGQGGMLDVAVDPDYSENGWIYLGYSHALNPGDRRSPAMTRIVRGRIKNHQWTDQQVLFEAPPETYLTTRHHYGTRIVFDRKGLLYFAIGERGHQDHAQDLSRPNGKIHRINRDGSIPSDNPFVNQQGALPSIFSYGHRNPQGLAFHPETDALFGLEHGPRGGDELNLCRAGRNYGWPVITYGINYNGKVITDQRRKDGMEQPVYYWRPSTAVCGLDFYRGGEFPQWNNHLLVANLKDRDVRLLDLERGRVMHEEIILDNIGRVREAVCDPDGAIYVVQNDPDEILRITSLGRMEYTR